MNEPSANYIDQFHDQFITIHDADFHEVNPIPEDQYVTVYCEGDRDNIGYVWNVKGGELGLEALIARKWILQSKLEDLMRFNNS